MGIVEQYFSQVNMKKQRFFRNFALLTILSLLVVVAVSWNLRQTGIAIANDASCGMEEHLHTEACVTELVLVCGSGTEAQPEEPTEEPTEAPTEEPTVELKEAPTEEPTAESTEAPTEEPTVEPTEVPTEEPTAEPTEAPTEEPTVESTEAPTEEPATESTEAPAQEP